MTATLKSGVKILQWRCCRGKTKYTEQEAEEQLLLVKASGDKDMVKYGPCRNCGFFHLGHKRIK